MKAIIEFNLPEDEYEYYCATKGMDMFSVLWQINQELRKLYKYEELNEDECKIVERIRNKFFDILEENNINLNK